MRVRLVDLQGQFAALHDQALTAIRFVYTSHQFIAIQTRLFVISRLHRGTCYRRDDPGICSGLNGGAVSRR